MFDLVNLFAKENGFGIVRRNAYSYKGRRIRYSLQCDRFGQPGASKGAGLRQRKSWKFGCKWMVVAEALEEGKWLLRQHPNLEHSQHNRGPSITSSAHPSHRRVTTPVRATIESTSRRVGNRARDVRAVVEEQHPESSFTQRDIYNARALMNRKKLNGYTPTAALVKLFDEMEIPYLVKWADDQPNRLLGLVRTFPYCIQMWKRFLEVIGFDNTYNKRQEWGLFEDRREKKRSTTQHPTRSPHWWQSRQAARQEQLRLTTDQEDDLERWILRQEKLGHAPTHAQVRTIVRSVLARHGDHAPLGRKWTTRFVERHPALKTKLGRRTDWERVNAATPANIKRLFDVYETVDWIPPERQYNADEGGIMEGQGVNGLVIGSSQESPNAVPVKTATVHLGCFSSLKAAYRTLVGEHTALTDSTRVGKQRFLDFYARAREIGFQKENIQSGWRAAGLWPVNINKPLASRWVMVLTKSALPPSETHDIVTPKRGGDVVKLFSAKSSSPSSRLSIRKAAAALDKVAIELAMKDREIERSSPDDSDWEDSAPQAQAELSVTDKQLVHALTGDGIPHTYRRVLMMWKRVLFARTEEAHEKAWRDLCKKFDDQRLILRYLHGTYLPVRAQWTRCILRKHRNFGIRVTSGTEASNNNIKSYLLNGMSHLYRLVEAMQDMMKDQERDFKDACAQDEVLTAREYLGSSGDYLGDLPTVISSKALRLINKQYRIARKAVPTGKNPFPEPLSGCNDDCSVSVELGVSCCHKVYAKLGSATSFTRYDVHSHWRLRDSSFQDPCRWILDTRIASALRGRPKNTAQPVPSRMAIGGRSQNVSQLTSLAARHPAGRK
ncbi:hypothetical protein HZS61_007805 [Fusarium oxysporum f. sp. conglutinans]|uniref:HTH CENPB-type domain-containing protein n=1 Tax=Fusarium oxysporum f. sp. conglutinans TaxID=100902 RepID=A0A8H6GZJ5_FUSOX|nr:hypothetical protein HZS61_007805 [Fusarium oxysporum f. sp. conglutinans]